MKILDEQEQLREDRASLPIDSPDISVFLPVFNEEPNSCRCTRSSMKRSKALGRSAEIVYVDDGSSDGSLKILREIAELDPRVRVVALRRNYGQTAAMAAGIDAARGKVLIPMDADLQNDPADIARLLEKLDEGYDVVSGWRKNRKDKMVTRKIPSMLANRLISWIGGVPLHDYGCSLKAYRRESLEDVRLYGEMHRFIPIYAAWAGARVTEIPVEHHARTMGKSKYGLSRTIKVVFDLMTIKFMASYQTKPIYVFGSFGHARVCDLSFERALRRLSEDLSQSRFRPNAFAGFVHRDVCGGSSVFVDGPARGNARAHLSRITSESDLRRARTIRLQGSEDSQITNMCGITGWANLDSHTPPPDGRAGIAPRDV